MAIDFWRIVFDALTGGDPAYNPLYPGNYAVSRYFTIVVDDGDWLNDWLTHLPEAIRSFVAFLGYLIAVLIGS